MPVENSDPALKPKVKVFLVDDHPLVREGLSMMINREPDMTVCGEAQEVAAAIPLIDALSPDILIVDVSMNGPGGLELVRTIRLRDTNLPILVLSMLDETIYAERALRAGANGYIMKQEATEKVLVAIRRILGGEIYLSARIASNMLTWFAQDAPAEERSPVSLLSDRELEVFCLIGEGQGTREIAETLAISVKTVESYQAHIKDKLSLKNSRALVQRAIQWSINEKNRPAEPV